MKLPPAESTALAQRRPGGQGHIHEEPERGFSRPVLPRSATVASPERSGARGGRGNLLAGEPSEWKRSGGNVNNGQLAETLIQQQVSLLEAELLREAAMGRDVDIQEQLERFELKMRMALAQRTVEGTDERTWHMEAEEQQQWRLQNLQRAGEGEDRHKQPAAAHPIPMTSGRSGASPGSDFQRHRAVRKTSGRSGSASPGSDFQRHRAIRKSGVDPTSAGRESSRVRDIPGAETERVAGNANGQPITSPRTSPRSDAGQESSFSLPSGTETERHAGDAARQPIIDQRTSPRSDAGEERSLSRQQSGVRDVPASTEAERDAGNAGRQPIIGQRTFPRSDAGEERSLSRQHSGVRDVPAGTETERDAGNAGRQPIIGQRTSPRSAAGEERTFSREQSGVRDVPAGTEAERDAGNAGRQPIVGQRMSPRSVAGEERSLSREQSGVRDVPAGTEAERDAGNSGRQPSIGQRTSPRSDAGEERSFSREQSGVRDVPAGTETERDAGSAGRQPIIGQRTFPRSDAGEERSLSREQTAGTEAERDAGNAGRQPIIGQRTSPRSDAGEERSFSREQSGVRDVPAGTEAERDAGNAGRQPIIGQRTSPRSDAGEECSFLREQSGVRAVPAGTETERDAGNAGEEPIVGLRTSPRSDAGQESNFSREQSGVRDVPAGAETERDVGDIVHRSLEGPRLGDSEGDGGAVRRQPSFSTEGGIQAALVPLSGPDPTSPAPARPEVAEIQGLLEDIAQLRSDARRRQGVLEQGTEELARLKLLISLGTDRRRCHRCDLAICSLRCLLRSLAQVFHALDMPDWELLSEVAKILTSVAHVDAHLAELAMWLGKDWAASRLRGAAGQVRWHSVIARHGVGAGSLSDAAHAVRTQQSAVADDHCHGASRMQGDTKAAEAFDEHAVRRFLADGDISALCNLCGKDVSLDVMSGNCGC
ncbi:unnamed protein product [Effrenium voratum]|uniref:Uncharacterized protein n=1 Tax=Effrenium voratum TaxID=2562239 RepID=A0AA36HPC0_9DINO|nr:unnamed protein product [Effrenium voratum]